MMIVVVGGGWLVVGGGWCRVLRSWWVVGGGWRMVGMVTVTTIWFSSP